MVKNRIFFAVLCGVVLLSLAGCNHTETETLESKLSETVSQTVIAESKPKPQTRENTTSPAETKSPEQTTAEKENTTLPVQTAEGIKPAQTQKAKTEQPIKQTEPPAPLKPFETLDTQQIQVPKPAETTVKPEESIAITTKPPETTTEEFDINYWVFYAQSYAQSIGLQLEGSAVDCWDNPMVAGSHCIYLQRDIESRLDRYNRDEGITDVWIWSEQRSDGDYDLYIGYA